MSIREHRVVDGRSGEIYVRFIFGTISICLGRPHVAALNLFFVCLFVIYPPKAQESSPGSGKKLL